MGEILLFRLVATLLASLTALVLLPPLRDPETDQYGDVYEYATTETTGVPRRGIDAHPTVTSLPPLQATFNGCQEALALAVKVGWPLNQMRVAATVLYRESNCTNTHPDGSLVHNRRDPKGGSYCAWQLNGAHFERTPWRPQGFFPSLNIGVNRPEDLANAELCFRAALALYHYAETHYGDGWQPWAATRP